MTSRLGLRAVVLFALNLLVIAAVTISADLRILPLQLVTAVPYYDKVGHFILYGLLGFLLHIVLRYRTLKIGRVSVPYALLIIAALAMLDEFQQSFMPARSFDATDFAADMIGVLFFIGIADYLHSRRIDGKPGPITIKP